MQLYILSFIFSFFLCFRAIGRFFLDHPNERSSHFTPTSRFGGTAIGCSVFITLIIAWYLKFISLSLQQQIFLGSLAFLWAVGVVDDYRHLSPRFKFIAQTIFSAGIILSGLRLPLPPVLDFFEIPFSLFMFICFINASNYCDSLNGLWSSLCLLVLATCYMMIEPYHNTLNNNVFELFYIKIVFISILGFYFFNLKGKIFLGDSGSTFLGGSLLILALLIIKNCKSSCSETSSSYHFYFVYVHHFIPALSALFFPFADIVFTTIRRLLKGFSIADTHKEHAAQKLVQSGFSHLKVTLIYVICSIIVVISYKMWVLGFYHYTANWCIDTLLPEKPSLIVNFSSWFLVYLILQGLFFYWVDRIYKKVYKSL